MKVAEIIADQDALIGQSIECEGLLQGLPDVERILLTDQTTGQSLPLLYSKRNFPSFAALVYRSINPDYLPLFSLDAKLTATLTKVNDSEIGLANMTSLSFPVHSNDAPPGVQFPFDHFDYEAQIEYGEFDVFGENSTQISGFATFVLSPSSENIIPYAPHREDILNKIISINCRSFFRTLRTSDDQFVSFDDYMLWAIVHYYLEIFRGGIPVEFEVTGKLIDISSKVNEKGLPSVLKLENIEKIVAKYVTYENFR